MVLVIIDGLDASGKNTQADMLTNLLKKLHKSVFLRVHPSADNLLGIKTKQFLYLKGRNAHFASATFYMLDVVRSVLLYSWRKYDFVIFVRYLMGTAYLPSPLHEIAYYFFAATMPNSDFMFFLDVEPEEAYKRIKHARSRQEMFENLSGLKQVRHKALCLALVNNWIIVDANKSAQNVHLKIAGYFQCRFDLFYSPPE